MAAHEHARPLHAQGGQAVGVLAHQHAVLEHPHVPGVRYRAQHGELLPELEEVVHAHADRLLAPEDGEVQVARQPDGPGRDAVLVGREGEVEHAAPAAEAVHPQGAHEREGPAHPDGAGGGRERQVHRRLSREHGRMLHQGLRGDAAIRRAWARSLRGSGPRACAGVCGIACAAPLRALRGGHVHDVHCSSGKWMRDVQS
mmetsp:Transcript_5991/g.16347  ORF Transcript_5991/g.16347 Transcript_5991/m.16347 type:complete len:200 (+) Transcript_5991:719-1318(+)